MPSLAPFHITDVIDPGDFVNETEAIGAPDASGAETPALDATASAVGVWQCVNTLSPPPGASLTGVRVSLTIDLQDSDGVVIATDSTNGLPLGAVPLNPTGGFVAYVLGGPGDTLGYLTFAQLSFFELTIEIHNGGAGPWGAPAFFDAATFEVFFSAGNRRRRWAKRTRRNR